MNNKSYKISLYYDLRWKSRFKSETLRFRLTGDFFFGKLIQETNRNFTICIDFATEEIILDSH